MTPRGHGPLPRDELLAAALRFSGAYALAATVAAFILLSTVALFARERVWLAQERMRAARAEAAEKVLAGVLETVPVGVLLLDADGLVTYANRGAETILGLGMVDIIGRTVDEIPALCGSSEAGSLSRVLRGTRAGAAHAEVSRTGVARTVRIDAVPTGADARTAGWVVSVADATEEQAARERARRLVHGYRYLSQAATVMSRASTRRSLLDQVARLAVEEGGFAAAWVLHRWAAEEQEADVSFYGAGEAVCEVGHLVRAFSPGTLVMTRLEGGEILVSNDLEHDPRDPWYACAAAGGWKSSATIAVRAPDGQSVVLSLLSDRPGCFDADVQELLLSIRSSLAFALARLVLDRRRLSAEEALERSERSHRILFVNHPQPMIVYDRDSTQVLTANQAACAKYGYTREEFEELTIPQLMPPVEAARFARARQRSRGSGPTDEGIWTHVDRQGRSFPVHVSTQALEWSGQPAILAMVMEIAAV